MAETELEDLQFLDALKFKIFDSDLFFLNRSFVRVDNPSRQFRHEEHLLPGEDPHQQFRLALPGHVEHLLGGEDGVGSHGGVDDQRRGVCGFR